MSRADTDIDIDLADRDAALEHLRHIPAMLPDGGRHNTSVYFQDIPQNPFTGLAAFDYKRAADWGYFKIDLLNNSIYQRVRDEAHLVELVYREPLWELFGDRKVVEHLHHIHGHFPVVAAIQPKSIDDLAVILALIRPGKKHLLGRPRAQIDAEIWHRVPGEAYVFKKSHAYAYAVSIVVQLNLLLEATET